MTMIDATLPMYRTTHCRWLKALLMGCWLFPAGAVQSAGFYAAIDVGTNVSMSREAVMTGDSRFFAETAVIDDESLDMLRGGFSVSGMDLNFGATLKTRIDSMHLESTVRIDRLGAQLTSQRLNGMEVAALPAEFQAMVVNGGGAINDMAPSSLNLTGLKDYSGLALHDTQGFTAALHNITKQAIVSAVVSDASQRSVQQTIDININVKNMPALQAASQRQAILNSLAR